MADVLLDTCIGGGVHRALINLGHNVDWSGLWQNDPGDRAILHAAHSTQRILVTLDKDFGELAIRKRLPHAGIIRLAGFRVAQMAIVIDHVLRSYPLDLSRGAVITVNPKGIRIREP